VNYTEFQADPAYNSKFSGSHIGVQLVDDDDPALIILGAASGLNFNENFEALVVEETGEEGPNEIVQGRYDGAVSLSAFWTPKWNDTAPTRQSFIGKKYTILEVVAPNRPGEGTVLNAFRGCVLRSLSQAFGARGLVTFDLQFVYLTRYSGEEWAAQAGS
jgi:hypothetical protein